MSKYLTILISLILVLTGCQSPQPSHSHLPYDYWELGERYPRYFTARPQQVIVLTQSNQWRGAAIIGGDSDKTFESWKAGQGGGGLEVHSDLPQEIVVCWASYVDQTFYKTRIKVPLWARQEMVKPREFYAEAFNENYIRYKNIVLLAFAPGGNVTGWITGNYAYNIAVNFGQGVTQRVPQNLDVCPNPYIDGKIPEITDEAKAWLKHHGMPAEWREENNNITLAPDIRIKWPTTLSNH